MNTNRGWTQTNADEKEISADYADYADSGLRRVARWSRAGAKGLVSRDVVISAVAAWGDFLMSGPARCHDSLISGCRSGFLALQHKPPQTRICVICGYFISSSAVRLDEDGPHLEAGSLFLHGSIGRFRGEPVGSIENFGEKLHVTGGCEMDAGTR